MNRGFATHETPVHKRNTAEELVFRYPDFFGRIPEVFAYGVNRVVPILGVRPPGYSRKRWSRTGPKRLSPPAGRNTQVRLPVPVLAAARSAVGTRRSRYNSCQALVNGAMDLVQWEFETAYQSPGGDWTRDAAANGCWAPNPWQTVRRPDGSQIEVMRRPGQTPIVWAPGLEIVALLQLSLARPDEVARGEMAFRRGDRRTFDAVLEQVLKRFMIELVHVTRVQTGEHDWSVPPESSYTAMSYA